MTGVSVYVIGVLVLVVPVLEDQGEEGLGVNVVKLFLFVTISMDK